MLLLFQTEFISAKFLLTPNYEDIAAMPFSIKIHVASAFVFVAIIPFTRLMHFLVIPFIYIAHACQYVI